MLKTHSSKRTGLRACLRARKRDRYATTSPDTGVQSAQYDALGLPRQIIDALGQATTITRDALGRPTLITQQDGRSTQLRYDLAGTAYNAAGSPSASKGYLSEIADTTDKTSYLRDGFGRILKKTQQLAPFSAGTAKTVQYSYATSPTGQGAGNGLISSITYPNGSKLSYVYSAAGQISQLNWGANPLVTGITYTPLGQPASWNWEFADTSATTVVPASRVYDSAGRLVQNELGTYTYNSAGRITSLTQQLYKPSNTTTSSTAITATTAVYSIGYDSLGRISSFSRAGGTGAASTAPIPTQTAIFTYDANGNRLSSIQSVGSGTATSTTSRSYSVDAASNRLLGFAQTLTTGTATGGATVNIGYSYDANGSLLKDGLRSYELDAANRLANVTTGSDIDAPTTRYVHNALGQRLFKTEPQFPPVATGSNPNDPAVIQILTSFFASLWGGSTTVAAPSTGEKLGFQYFYDEAGSLLFEQGTGGAQSTGRTFYVHLPTPSGPMPIAVYLDAKHYAVHTDHLNTPRRLTSSSKQPVWQWAFSAFGDEVPTKASNRFADPATTPNAGTTTVADVTFNLRYPGQYFDKESGLNYNYFRSYDSKTGRYTQSDPIDLAGGWNKFGYAEGNPLMYTDPLGLWVFGDSLPQQVVDFSAGLGDSLLLGTGGALRDMAGVDGGVNVCGDAYDYGAYASLAVGGGRLAYAGLAKAGSILAASGTQASAFRAGLKTAFRGGVGGGWRPPNLAGKTDAQLRASAGKTNFGMNAYGAGVGTAGAMGAAQCGCPK
jgi:RHS repeat-associated protein